MNNSKKIQNTPQRDERIRRGRQFTSVNFRNEQLGRISKQTIRPHYLLALQAHEELIRHSKISDGAVRTVLAGSHRLPIVGPPVRDFLEVARASGRTAMPPRCWLR